MYDLWQYSQRLLGKNPLNRGTPLDSENLTNKRDNLETIRKR